MALVGGVLLDRGDHVLQHYVRAFLGRGVDELFQRLHHPGLCPLHDGQEGSHDAGPRPFELPRADLTQYLGVPALKGGLKLDLQVGM